MLELKKDANLSQDDEISLEEKYRKYLKPTSKYSRSVKVVKATTLKAGDVLEHGNGIAIVKSDVLDKDGECDSVTSPTTTITTLHNKVNIGAFSIKTLLSYTLITLTRVEDKTTEG